MIKNYELVVEVWSKSQVVRTGPTWDGEPQATAFVEQLVADWPSSRAQVMSLIQHSNALVVAHALLCARRANEPALAALDTDILESKAGVTIQEGSFRTSTNIGGLARKWAKEVHDRVNGEN